MPGDNSLVTNDPICMERIDFHMHKEKTNLPHFGEPIVTVNHVLLIHPSQHKHQHTKKPTAYHGPHACDMPPSVGLNGFQVNICACVCLGFWVGTPTHTHTAIDTHRRYTHTRMHTRLEPSLQSPNHTFGEYQISSLVLINRGPPKPTTG